MTEESVELRRREFLKGLVGTLGALVIADPIVEAVAAVAPEPLPYEMGEAVQWPRYRSDLTNKWGDEHLWAADMLRERARLALPPGTRFEIRLGMPHNYGRLQGAAWYYRRDLAERLYWKAEKFEPPVFKEDLGCYLISRDIA